MSKLRITFALVLAALTGTTWAAPAYASSIPKVSAAFSTPNVSKGFTPQGMTATPSGKLLLAEYKLGSNTRLVDVSTTGKVFGTASIADTHAGGIAIVGQWLFVQDGVTVGSDSIRRYRVADLNAALAISHRTGKPAYLKAAGVQKMAAWQFASVMCPDGQQLLAGHHGVGDGARLYRYDVASDGTLVSVSYTMIPDNAQGIAAAGTVVTSGGGHLLSGVSNQDIPSHAEGVVVIGKTAFIAFEGGAANIGRINL